MSLALERFAKVKLLMISAAAVVLTSGCSTVIPLSPENKQAIHDVTLDKNITQPDSFYYYGRASMSFGFIGSMIDSSTGDEFLAMVKKEKIVVSDMVASEFSNQIKARNFFTNTQSANAQATFKLKVTSYGLALASGFSVNAFPTLSIQAQLVKPDGTIIWEKTDNVTALNSETKGFNIDEYKEDPRKLQTALQSASVVVVKSLIDHLTAASDTKTSATTKPSASK